MPSFEIFLKLAGIDGESAVEGHVKEIAVLSYEQAIDALVVHSGGGGGAAVGKAKFSAVRFRKAVDVASIPLQLACASGQPLAEARFTFRRGAMGFAYHTVRLESVLVTHVSERAGTGLQYPLTFAALDAGASNDGFLEEIALEFARIRWEHRGQRPDGSPVIVATGGWDVTANKKL